MKQHSRNERNGQRMRSIFVSAGFMLVALVAHGQRFELNADGYFNAGGTDVMAFSDFYPEGHQGGVCVIMNGRRVATNGDIRLEATPGQWQPVPKQLSRKVEGKSIVTTLCYPDSSRHLTGFNPMVYPEWNVQYRVSVEAKDQGILVTVDLDTPVPEYLLGKVGFNLELYPGDLFGKPWIMEGAVDESGKECTQSGIYPQQPNSPLLLLPTNRDHDGQYFAGRGQKADLAQLDGERTEAAAMAAKPYSPLRADDVIAAPYAVGRRFTSRPDDGMSRLTVESYSGDLKLIDGRMNHNNGWFVLRSEITKGKTKGAVRWLITPEVQNDWISPTVIQTSQVGYRCQQPKRIVIETDRRDSLRNRSADGRGDVAELLQIVADGEHVVRRVRPTVWGNFLRYRYLIADFSDVTEPGLYQVRYGTAKSSVFRIAENVFARGVWQPVVEYFLPVQMCHMRVSEKYRIWHDACHMDDALMAKVGNHIDGYDQWKELIPEGKWKLNDLAGDITRKKWALNERGDSIRVYMEGERVPNVNIGGWHDAGDFDLRVESQAGEAYILALAYEMFHPDIDVTAIDHERHRVEIHKPDGRNDILQQVENGAYTVVNSYYALGGQLYRGIITSTLRQYAMLGDAAAMTDGLPNDDDRWIFTENNPSRALTTAAELACASRVLRGFNDELSSDCIDVALRLFRQHGGESIIAEATSLPYSIIGGKAQGSVGNGNVKGKRAQGSVLNGNAKGKRAQGSVPSGFLTGPMLQAAVELYLTTGEQAFLDFILSQQDYIVRNISRSGWCVARIAKQLSLKKEKRAREFTKAFNAALMGYKKQLDEQAAETPYGVPYRPSIWGAGWDIQRFGFEYYFLANAYPEVFPMESVFNALNFILGCHPGSNSASFASGVGARSATVAYGLNRADWSYIPGGVVSGTALIRPDFPELLEFPYLWQQTEYVLGGGSSHFMFLVLAVNHFGNPS